MVVKNAFSTSVDAFLLSRHMAYYMTAASQGSLICPSSHVKPNSSWDISKSSAKTGLLRYSSVEQLRFGFWVIRGF
jgi:hypothetical protein